MYPSNYRDSKLLLAGGFGTWESRGSRDYIALFMLVSLWFYSKLSFVKTALEKTHFGRHNADRTYRIKRGKMKVHPSRVLKRAE